MARTMLIQRRTAIGNRPEFGAGLLFLLIGIVGAVLSLQYHLGTPTEMGPGFFPLIVSTLLGLLGLGSMLRATGAQALVAIGQWPFVPTLFVVAAILAFAKLVDRWGLPVAVIALVAVAGYHGWRRRPLEVLFIACILAVVSAGIFIYGLALPFTID